jgi:indole-3-glycerol phosphate synthase
MNILDKIIEQKKVEIAQAKKQIPVSSLEHSEYFQMPVRSLSASLLKENSTGIIAEFKRKSPSKGYINQNANVAEITSIYEKFGAAGLSVLTDEQFFGGSKNDLLLARKNTIPILRKDFVIDEYQIFEAKSIGADVVLLIAACLTPQEVKHLAKTASSLKLETILELHEEAELEHICDEINIIGINNRNLKTFEVNIERSLRMAEKLPNEKLKIAESGINKIEDILLLKKNGFKGFLIGEYFMRQSDVEKSFQEFAKNLREKNV